MNGETIEHHSSGAGCRAHTKIVAVIDECEQVTNGVDGSGLARAGRTANIEQRWNQHQRQQLTVRIAWSSNIEVELIREEVSSHEEQHKSLFEAQFEVSIDFSENGDGSWNGSLHDAGSRILVTLVHFRHMLRNGRTDLNLLGAMLNPIGGGWRHFALQRRQARIDGGRRSTRRLSSVSLGTLEAQSEPTLHGCRIHSWKHDAAEIGFRRIGERVKCTRVAQRLQCKTVRDRRQIVDFTVVSRTDIGQINIVAHITHSGHRAAWSRTVIGGLGFLGCTLLVLGGFLETDPITLNVLHDATDVNAELSLLHCCSLDRLPLVPRAFEIRREWRHIRQAEGMELHDRTESEQVTNLWTEGSRSSGLCSRTRWNGTCAVCSSVCSGVCSGLFAILIHVRRRIIDLLRRMHEWLSALLENQQAIVGQPIAITQRHSVGSSEAAHAMSGGEWMSGLEAETSCRGRARESRAFIGSTEDIVAHVLKAVRSIQIVVEVRHSHGSDSDTRSNRNVWRWLVTCTLVTRMLISLCARFTSRSCCTADITQDASRRLLGHEELEQSHLHGLELADRGDEAPFALCEQQVGSHHGRHHFLLSVCANEPLQ